MSSVISHAFPLFLPSIMAGQGRDKFVPSSSHVTSQGSKVEQAAEEWVLTLAAEPGWEDQSPELQLMEIRWQSGLQPPSDQIECFEKGEDVPT